MREIKFRGWHFSLKKMFSAEEMASDQMTLLPTGQFINVHSRSTILSRIFSLEEFLPLQYTGLKDKNGKEIYEGDIVETNNKNFIAEVIFETGCFITQEKNQAEIGVTLRSWETKYLEVAGNIYENPELLGRI